MSMRLRMGCVQMFVTPGMRSFSSSRCIMASFVWPAGHWSFGLKVTIVSLMLIGAGSVEVSARPIFPMTDSTATDLMRQQDGIIARDPAVESVIGKIGRAETSTDPDDRFDGRISRNDSVLLAHQVRGRR